jgi:hypothetical protein
LICSLANFDEDVQGWEDAGRIAKQEQILIMVRSLSQITSNIKFLPLASDRKKLD